MSARNQSQPNRWKEYHEFLKLNDPKKFDESIEGICEELNITSSTFYRYLSNHEKISPASKTAIAKVYQLPKHFIFPEKETNAQI